MLACLLSQFTHDTAITCQSNNSVPGRELCREQPLAGPHSSLPRLLKMSFLIKVTAILKVTHNVVTCTSCQQTKQRAGTSLPKPLQDFSTLSAQAWQVEDSISAGHPAMSAGIPFASLLDFFTSGKSRLESCCVNRFALIDHFVQCPCSERD